METHEGYFRGTKQTVEDVYGFFLREQIPEILFCFTILNFSPSFFERPGQVLGQRISQTVLDRRKIPTEPRSGVRGTIKVYLSFPKIFPPFSPFPRGVENVYS